MVFPLPLINTDILVNELETQLIENFKEDKEEINKTLNETGLDWQFYFKNLRDVKRFLNAFLQYYPFVKQEVLFRDYFLVVLMQKYFNDLHKEISKNSIEYLNKNSPSNKVYLHFTTDEKSNDFPNNDKEESFRIVNYIKNLNLNEIEAAALIKLLEKLFQTKLNNVASNQHMKFQYPYQDVMDNSEKEYSDFSKSILDPSNFSLYFTNNDLGSVITNSEFRSFLKLEENHILNCIDFLLLHEKQVAQLIDKFLYYFITPNQPNFQKWYYGYIYLLKKVRDYYYTRTLLQLIAFDETGDNVNIFTALQQIDSHFNFSGLTDGEKRIHFNNTFKDRFSMPTFDAQLLYDLRKAYYSSNQGESFFMTNKELLDMNIFLLENKINSIKDGEKVNDELFSIYLNCEIEFDKNDNEIDKRANNLMRKFFNNKNRLYDLLRNGGRDLYSFYTNTDNIFSGYKNFEKELKTHFEEAHFIIQFYEKYKANNFKPFSLSENPQLKKEVDNILNERPTSKRF